MDIALFQKEQHCILPLLFEWIMQDLQGRRLQWQDRMWYHPASCYTGIEIKLSRQNKGFHCKPGAKCCTKYIIALLFI